MLNMGFYDVWSDNLSDFLKKQNASLNPWWTDMYEKCYKSALMLNVFGFMEDEEMKRIMNLITIRILLEAEYE